MRFLPKTKWARHEEKILALEDTVRALADELETTKKAVAEFELDYNMLYEKIRVNLAKLAKRAERAGDDATEVDPVQKARQLLLAKKFGGNSGL